jgi:hypothetical protein
MSKLNFDEYAEQCAYVEWFAYQYPELKELLTLGSIGVDVGLKKMLRLKKMGYENYFPDLVLFYPAVVYNVQKCALFIEMKSKTGKLNDGQRQKIILLSHLGYYAAKANCAEEAINITREYLHDYKSTNRLFD